MTGFGVNCERNKITCVGGGVGTCAYVSNVNILYMFRGHGIVSSVLLYHSLPHVFEMGCLTEPEARLGWQLEKAPETLLSPPFQPTPAPPSPCPQHTSGVSGTCMVIQAFYMVAEDPNLLTDLLNPE